MYNKIFYIIMILATVLGGVFFLSSRLPQKNALNSRIHIVTSFYPLSYVANMVGGNLVSVQNLVPAGVEPHDFEPSTRNLVEIGNADALLYNGVSLESWVRKWEESTKTRPKNVVNMANSLKERNVNFLMKDEIPDPHFWLDPNIMKIEAEVVRDLLIKIDPEHKEIFVSNANRFLVTLDSLDERYRSGLAFCGLRNIIVLHKAFDYQARQYGFSVTSIEGISPDEEPSPRDLARIVSLAQKNNIKYIFAETFASPKFSELIAREIGGTTLVLNPIESLTPNDVQSGEDYISIMEMNLNNLKKAMVCN